MSTPKASTAILASLYLASGPHWLTNDAQGRTYCRGCKVEWRVLDAEARAAS